MAKITDVNFFDQRVVKHYLKKEEVKQKDYQDFLKSLPDESKNATELAVYEEPVEFNEPTFQVEESDSDVPPLFNFDSNK